MNVDTDFLIGLIIGACIAFGICSFFWILEVVDSRELIKSCEAELPRNEHCKLIAVQYKEV